jgi:hypothetical protein
MRRQQQSARVLAELHHRLDREARVEERRHVQREQLDKYREPLIAATEGLWHRIDNLRTKGFGRIYFDLEDDRRRSRMAMLGTLYRFGRYWCIVDQLAQSVNRLRFETEDETKVVAELLTEIQNTFSSDSPDHGGRSLMVWREEQRGIAELMRAEPGSESLATIGFATFVDRYDGTFSMWFAELESGLRTPELISHRRLAALQGLLHRLIEALERGRRHAFSA